MKLLLLHGLGIISSRRFLSSLKGQFESHAITIFDKQVTFSDLQAECQGISLFSEKRLIVVENPPPNLAGENLAIDNTITLVFWCNTELTSKSELLQFVKQNRGEIKLFSEAKEMSVFPLLDLLGSRNNKAFIELQKLKEEKIDFQYILTMMFYLLRTFIQPPAKAPDFIKRKIAKQRELFGGEEITNIYRSLIDLDYRIKSGLIEKNHAEFLAIQLFLQKHSI